MMVLRGAPRLVSLAWKNVVLAQELLPLEIVNHGQRRGPVSFTTLARGPLGNSVGGGAAAVLPRGVAPYFTLHSTTHVSPLWSPNPIHPTLASFTRHTPSAYPTSPRPRDS